MNKTGIVVVCVLSWLGLKAQAPADSLAPVTVSATRFTQFATGTKTAVIDSVASVTFQTQTLADLLASQSQVFIKSYGQGIATASFRGSSAEQTAVLWKGFNLQNPMFGQVDFSLIQGDAADKIEIQYGGNGALFGSGAVGGTIQLVSKARYGSGLHGSAGLQVGSFGHIRTQAGLSYGGAKWFSTLRVFGLSVENDFPYTNTFLQGSPEVKQTNAAAKQQGLINENYIRLSSAQELNINIWYQDANREVPPGMSVPVTAATQKDQSFRTTAEWRMNQQRVTWAARTAYFDESVDYTNPVSLLLSGNSRSQTIISEAESTIRLHAAHRINIGVNNTYTHAFADGYEGSFNRNRTALFVSYKTDQLIRNVTTSLSVRQEWTAGTDIPLIPAFGFEWKATRWLSLFGNVSRSYRLPTFNELYWKSVTTHVQPESGWGEELNVRAQTSSYGFTVSATAGVFNRNIHNWIVWLPSTIDWAPQNIKEVWSRGAEFDGKLSYAFRKVTLSYHFMVNYVLSTNKESTIPNDDAVGKQLLYVPRITQQHQLMAAFRTWHIGLLQNYVGLRYITTDNSMWLENYSLTSLVAGKQFNIRKVALVLSVQANNLFDVSYQAIADRPMPGRNFLLNTTFKF